MTELLLRIARVAVALLAVATAVVVVPSVARSDFDPLPAAEPAPTSAASTAALVPAPVAPPVGASTPGAAPAPVPAATAPGRLYLLPPTPPSPPPGGGSPTVAPEPMASPGPAGPAPDPATGGTGASGATAEFGGSSSGAPTLLGEDVAGTAPAAPQPLVVPYRIDVRTVDGATADAAAAIEAILADPRGWSGAGYVLQRNDAAPYVVVLAEAAAVDALCAPYDTASTYSCQNGGTVALNADRWRTATPEWTGDLASYREYLVNHEVGHLLGQRHVDCPGAGQPSPVMVQQSTELEGCLPNGWPLEGELAVAAERDRPLAPGPEQ